jgi:hypothetical protein
LTDRKTKRTERAPRSHTPPVTLWETLRDLKPIPPDQTLVLGVDVGRIGITAHRGLGAFLVTQVPDGFELRVLAPTERTDYHYLEGLLGRLNVEGRVLVAVDAPMLSERTGQIPRGRQVEKRLSRGDFANASRGLQPSSIAVPRQGWRLYEKAMGICEDLAEFGIPYFEMPWDVSEIELPFRGVIEVLPKLTQGLLMPRRLISDLRPQEGEGHQIEHWLFPYMFLADPSVAGRPVVPDVVRPSKRFAKSIRFHASFEEEAERIWATHSPQCDSAINAFVAAFQGALAVAGLSSVVGCPGPKEGYITVPRHWHQDWESVWTSTARESDLVERIDLLAGGPKEEGSEKPSNDFVN